MWYPFRKKEKTKKYSLVTIWYFKWVREGRPDYFDINYLTTNSPPQNCPHILKPFNKLPPFMSEDDYNYYNRIIQKYLFDEKAGNFLGIKSIDDYVKEYQRREKIEKIKSKI